MKFTITAIKSLLPTLEKQKEVNFVSFRSAWTYCKFETRHSFTLRSSKNKIKKQKKDNEIKENKQLAQRGPPVPG